MNKHFEFMCKYLVIGCVSIFILLFACTSQSVWGADDLPVPVKNEYYIHYEKVVEVDDSFKQDVLFRRAKQWIAKYYTTSAMYNPIQLEDREDGLIIVRIYFRYNTHISIHLAEYTVHCVGKIQVKDGKYKYTFSEFTYVCSSTNKHYEEKEPRSGDLLIHRYKAGDPSSGSYKMALQGLDDSMIKVIASLHKSLTEPDDF